MKRIDIGNLFSIELPSSASWSFDGNSRILRVTSELAGFAVAFHVLINELEGDLLEVCHQILESYIRDSLGPPFQTSVQKIFGETWIGYQSVTDMENRTFKVNRCIASTLNGLVLRIEFDTNKSVDESLMHMLEELEFKK